MPSRRRVLIVGGVAGGASCAARLRRLDESLEIVLFDRGHELPKAVLIDKAPLGGLRAWLHAQWLWLSPRMVPVIVAAVGMILVLLSADYLAHSHYEPLPSWHP